MLVGLSVNRSTPIFNITNLTPSTAQGTLNFTFTSSVSGESVRAGTTVGGDTFLSRQHVTQFSENPYFTDKFASTGVVNYADPVAMTNGTWTISGVVDRSVIEVFVNGGQQSGTMTFFPEWELDVLMVSAGGIAGDGEVVVSVGVWGLVNTWVGVEDGNGTVRGNVTM